MKKIFCAKPAILPNCVFFFSRELSCHGAYFIFQQQFLEAIFIEGTTTATLQGLVVTKLFLKDFYFTSSSYRSHLEGRSVSISSA